MAEFTPRIIGFLCNWCSYAGADLAGVSRIKYAPNIRVIRVMCSGRVDPSFIIKAFLKRIDGVMILGCHFGDCHYINGNYNAEKRIRAARRLLSFTKIEPQRLMLDWVSAAEGDRFANLVNDFVATVKAIGPLAQCDEIDTDLLAINDVLTGEVFRHLTGVQWYVTEKENVYGEKIAEQEFDRKLDESLLSEFVRHRILRFLGDRILSVAEVSSGLCISVHSAFVELCALQDKGVVSLVDTKNDYPRYKTSR